MDNDININSNAVMIISFVFSPVATQSGSGSFVSLTNYYLLSTLSTPGNSLPSKYSSDAPPPVEICENFSA